MLFKMKRKTRERLHRVGTWIFLVIFVMSVAVAAIFLIAQPTNPAGH
jgi:hypothetical protein